MGNFVSAVFNQKGSKSKIYPTVLIFDSTGKIYHSDTGAFETYNEAKKDFVKLIEDLKKQAVKQKAPALT